MSSKTKNSKVPTQKQQIAPRLRFREFENEGGWEAKALGESVMPINEKVGDRICTPMSITSGVGLVSQMEKFGRNIAGQSYGNYILLQEGDFAYNKSATKEYPQGFIARYYGSEQAAVPNSIFSCFRIADKELNPEYLNYLFTNNLHGKWLHRVIAVGARAHGSLTINDSDIWSIPIPVPAHRASRNEQHKIADCLSSVDGLIDAETRKLDAIKSHKKGLMQLLFPLEDNAVPRFRFSAFRKARKWRRATIGEVFETSSGGTPDRSVPEYWGGDIPWVSTSLVDFNHIDQAQEHITEKGMTSSSTKLFPPGTILIAMYGQGQTRGKVAILDVAATTNQACAAIFPQKGIDPEFVFMYLSSCYEKLRKLSNSGGQENLSQSLIKKFTVAIPWDIDEQRVIKKCLSQLNSVITQQELQVSSLVRHKSGLMQQLFPVMGEEQE